MSNLFNFAVLLGVLCNTTLVFGDNNTQKPPRAPNPKTEVYEELRGFKVNGGTGDIQYAFNATVTPAGVNPLEQGSRLQKIEHACPQDKGLPEIAVGISLGTEKKGAGEDDMTFTLHNAKRGALGFFLGDFSTANGGTLTLMYDPGIDKMAATRILGRLGLTREEKERIVQQVGLGNIAGAMVRSSSSGQPPSITIFARG